MHIKKKLSLARMSAVDSSPVLFSASLFLPAIARARLPSTLASFEPASIGDAYVPFSLDGDRMSVTQAPGS